MKKILVGGIWLLSLLLLLPAGAAEKVTFSLTWVAYGRDIGFYAALDLKYFEQEGIEADLVRGFGDGDSVKKLAAGSFHLARLGMPVLIVSRSQDILVKSVGIQYDKNQDVIYALKGSGISKPKDLEGRTLGAPAAGGARLLFPAFAAANGVDVNKVKWISMEGPAEVPSLLAGRVDAIVTRTPAGPHFVELAAKQGKEIVQLLYADYGLDIYSSAIAATDKLIQEKAGLVRGFVKAALKGHAWAMENTEEAVTRFLKYHPTMDRGIAKKAWLIAVESQLTKDALKFGLGYTSRKKMETTVEVVSRYMKVQRPVRVEEVYTNDFLPGVFVRR